jgi:hypothetical protein
LPLPVPTVLLIHEGTPNYLLSKGVTAHGWRMAAKQREILDRHRPELAANRPIADDHLVPVAGLTPPPKPSFEAE